MASITTTVKGHVLIKDGNTGEILLDKNNAVHNKNMAMAIARGLSNSSNSAIYKVKLGNGGTNVDGINQITFQPPNVTGNTATLYNSTYEENVVSGPSENSVTYQLSTDPNTTALVICSITISSSEPAGQAVSDEDVISPSNSFAFDELGLFTNDDKLLTHIVFTPILKTMNRELVVTYVLTISVA